MNYKKFILTIVTISFLGLVIILFFILRGNFFKYTDINFMISKPKSDSILVSGTWKLNSVISVGVDDNSDFKEENLYIDKNFVFFENEVSYNPKFKFRQMNFKNYLFYNGIVNDKIKIDKEDVTIVSIKDEKNFYKEFIVLDKNKISIIYNKKYYIFDKISDDVDKNLLGNLNLDANVNNEKKDISFILGLKSSQNKNVSYETILLRKNGDNKVTANKISGIFVNNNNKFFIANSKGNNIYISNDYLNELNKNIIDVKNSTINFLSQNYISIESYNNDKSKKEYSIYKIGDFLDESNRMSIKDIAGDNGEQSYFNEIRKLGYSIDNISHLDLKNFGVKRNDFSWGFRGIVSDNYYNNFTSSEFNLNLIPEVNIFSNKSNKISKIKVKQKSENLLDYFVSPDENLIVILTNSDISVYEIKNKDIETLPIFTINLSEKKDVVNFQWENDMNSEFTYNEFLKIKQEGF